MSAVYEEAGVRESNAMNTVRRTIASVAAIPLFPPPPPKMMLSLD